MKIICYTMKFPEGYDDYFRIGLAKAAPGAEIIYYNDLRIDTEEEKEKIFGDADIVIGWTPPSLLKYAHNLKLLHLDSAGADTIIDSEDLASDAIVCNVSGAYGHIMAEHAMGLLLTVCRKIPYYRENMKQHLWQRGTPDKPIENCCAMILGAGDIGTTAAAFIRPMIGKGKIIGVRRVRRAIPPEFDEMITFEELDETLPMADIVIAALPSTKETYHLMDARRLRLMKKDAVLVNVGRGSLIPLDDLNTVLREGHLFGAGLDVAEPEPIPSDHPIWDCENLVITPHAAGIALSQSSPTYRRAYNIIFANIARFVKGEPLDHIVDRNTGYRKI